MAYRRSYGRRYGRRTYGRRSYGVRRRSYGRRYGGYGMRNRRRFYYSGRHF